MPKETQMTAKATANTADIINHQIADLALDLISKGANQDRAIRAATDHVLSTVAEQRPDIFSKYLRAMAA
jgi:hypothetical protein